MRVVIADDAAASRLLMRHTLQTSGAFDVVGEAADGLEAVDLAAQQQPDLVLLDLIMPRLDGPEAASRIRAVSPSARIVILSGLPAGDLASSPGGAALAAIDGGVDGYLEKRLAAGEILRSLVGICGSPRRPVTGNHGAAPSGPGAGRRSPRSEAAGRAGAAVPGSRAVPEGPGVASGPTSVASGPTPSPPPAPDDRSEAERDLERARADLALIGAAASHDFKSPLQAIVGFAHLLDQLYADVLDERGGAFIRTIIDASERMSGLVEGLAGFCRAIAVPPAAVPVALDRVAGAVLAGMEAEVAETGARVAIGELPDVVGDPDQIALVLASLLASALSWTPAGGGPPEVAISADRTPHGWTISVVDCGPGIEAGHRERAFTRFGPPPGRVGGLTGAASEVLGASSGRPPADPAVKPGSVPAAATGLALARRLVEGWGGSIWVEDVVGDARSLGDAVEATTRGCRIRFAIPDRVADGSPAPVRPDSGGDRPRWQSGLAGPLAAAVGRLGEEPVDDPVPGLPGTAPQQLLLVEDSEPHAHLVAATLAEAPGARYRLRHVTDLRQARRALKEQRVDLVLLDLSLPGSEGLETLEEMVGMAPGIPVVVLTSRSDEGLAVASVQQGAQDYLVKGAYEPASLARSIRYAIERKALESQLAQQALHDALTTLPNRTLLLERLNPALARGTRTGDKLALLYLDLDGFKPINDEFGHDAGDAVLIEVARRLRAVVRPQDTVARIGGDEFAVMCEGFRSDTEIRSLVSRMEDAIAQPIQIASPRSPSGHEARRVTASIGIAFASAAEMSAEELIRSADQAMYKIKRRGPEPSR